METNEHICAKKRKNISPPKQKSYLCNQIAENIMKHLFLSCLLLLSGNCLLQAQTPDSLAREQQLNVLRESADDILNPYGPLTSIFYMPFDQLLAPWNTGCGFLRQTPSGLSGSLTAFPTLASGASVPRGVGLGQSGTLLYTAPVNSRLSFMTGIHTGHMDWGGRSYRQAEVMGIAAYRLNDAVTLFAYGTKRLASEDMPVPFPQGLNRYNAAYYRDIDLPEERAGGSVRLQTGTRSYIHIDAEVSRTPQGKQQPKIGLGGSFHIAP